MNLHAINDDGLVLPAILSIGSGATEVMSKAIACFGDRVCSVDWEDAVEQMNRQSHDPVIVLDAQGVSDEILAAALYRIDAIAAARQLNVVAGFSGAQIDIVAAGLTASNVELLCDPDVSDWVAALSIARTGGAGMALYDPAREGETARLAKLNEEVARIAEVLARLSRDDESRRPLGGGVADERRGFEGPPTTVHIKPEDVRKIIRGRRLRDRFFGQGVFEDPAWDMILDLYAAHLARGQVSVSSLCIAAAVAPTTALRWIAKLTDAGLFVRQPDPFDRRRAYMALSARALDGMNRYVLATRDAGLPIA